MLANILIACVAGSALSLAIAAFVAFRVESRWVPTLVSYAVGALLGAVFLDLLPHIFEASKNHGRAAAFILFGILAFFVLEKLLLWRHHHHGEDECEHEAQGHYHAHDHGHDSGRSGWMIVVGDSFHNFTDGVIIASAFLADMRLGVVTAIAIVAHEIPQEIGDFVVLLHSGFSKRKALVANAVSGFAMVVGALIGYFALSAVSHWIPEILAIAAASMIYVAVADLIPGLHKRTAMRESLGQVAFIALGIASIWAIHATLEP
jgi:zinc and cadmium transporter